MFLTGHTDTHETEHTDEPLYSSRDRLKPVECFRQIKAQLRTGQQRNAFELLQQLVMLFPNEPVFLSYYGYLLVLVARRYRTGIETCLKSLEHLRARKAFDRAALYPVFYCNLGRAYAMAGKRKEALAALNKGLSYDRLNKDIIQEMQSMGMRRKTLPIPFLKRSNPLNRYCGIISYKKRDVSHAKKSGSAY
jgi:predicted Zn-dependent protease